MITKRTKIFKCGNSLNVRIPADFAKELGIKHGDMAKVLLNVKKERIVIKKIENDK